MLEHIKEQIISHFKDIKSLDGVDIILTQPPNIEMGDFAFPCFERAKRQGKNPVDLAQEIAKDIELEMKHEALVLKVQAFGPYVNFFLDNTIVAEKVFDSMEKEGEHFGKHDVGKGKQLLVEFACPNPMKVFHLGHLRNLITGEAVVRMFEYAGYDVKRVNYQGDVGMHIAKTLWGIDQLHDEFETVKNKDLKMRVAFLGRAYAFGSQAYEDNETMKEEIIAYNKKVYAKDVSIENIYTLGRTWSLEYFDSIYTMLNSHFDRLYFESEVVERGLSLVMDGLKKGIFKKSDGAIIFEGSNYELHDRVFVNSKDLPTYEGKEIGLAQLHFSEFHPDQVIHVVGKELTDYFKVLFKALETILPETVGKEYHLVGGYLQLKGDKKMSSRKGTVVAGDELLFAAEHRVKDIMKNSEVEDKDVVARAVTVAALKYSMLKVHVNQDISFDMEASVSTSGDSGPYLLYIVARIKSILKKADINVNKKNIGLPKEISIEEKQLIYDLASFPNTTLSAIKEYDPSIVAKYMYNVAQHFNAFYSVCPVLNIDDDMIRLFRLNLISRVLYVMEAGLNILGIESVEEM